MKTTFTQITVRGLDEYTKLSLQKKAAQEGVSLNKLASTALRQMAGTNSSTDRYQQLQNFFTSHAISHADVDAAQQAVAWMDKASKSKQHPQNESST